MTYLNDPRHTHHREATVWKSSEISASAAAALYLTFPAHIFLAPLLPGLIHSQPSFPSPEHPSALIVFAAMASDLPVPGLIWAPMTDTPNTAFLPSPSLAGRSPATTRRCLRGHPPAAPAGCHRHYAGRSRRFLPLPPPSPLTRTPTRTPITAGFDDPFDTSTLDPTVPILYLASRRLGDDGAAAVGALLAHPACAVTTLNLDSNGIGDEGAAALAAGLAVNTSLVDLIAWDNAISDAGAAALAGALATNNTLRVLSLARNAIGPAGGAALGNAMGTNSGLRAVYLMGMTRKGGGMTDTGAAAWADGIAANAAVGGPFWFANLDGNGITESGFEALRAARTPGVHHIYPVDPYPR